MAGRRVQIAWEAEVIVQHVEHLHLHLHVGPEGVDGLQDLVSTG